MKCMTESGDQAFGITQKAIIDLPGEKICTNTNAHAYSILILAKTKCKQIMTLTVSTRDSH